AGDGAVIVRINGELKIKSIKIDPEMVDLENIEELEHWIEIAIRDGMTAAQRIAAEKMKPLMVGLGNLGLYDGYLFMSSLLPSALMRAIDELGRLPGVGALTAERYAYFLLKTDAQSAQKLATAIADLHKNVK